MCFRSPFRGYIHICGHDKSAPTAADGLPFRCERIANNAANIPQQRNAHTAILG